MTNGRPKSAQTTLSVFEKLGMDLSQRILVLLQNDKHFRLGGIKC